MSKHEGRINRDAEVLYWAEKIDKMMGDDILDGKNWPNEVVEAIRTSNPTEFSYKLAELFVYRSDVKKTVPLESAENKIREIGRWIKGQTPPGWGFILILASYGADGRMTYMSSCERKDVVRLLRELSDKLESGEGSV